MTTYACPSDCKKPAARSVTITSHGKALATARTIENDIIASDLVDGALFGTYQQLQHTYRVGRTLIREAARIVELRGLARMRPGRNGGLAVTGRSRDLVARLVGGRLLVEGGSLVEAKEARLVVSLASACLAAEYPDVGARLRPWLSAHPLAADSAKRMQCTVLAFPVALAEASGNMTAALFARTLAASMGGRDAWETIWLLDESAARRSRKMEFDILLAIEKRDVIAAVRLMQAYHREFDEIASIAPWQRIHTSADNVIERTRAGQVARTILGKLLAPTLTGNSHLAQEQYIGSIRDLGIHTGACRATVVQALRLLEAVDAIVVKPGRNKGIYLKPQSEGLSEEWLFSYIVSRPEVLASAKRFNDLLQQDTMKPHLKAPRHNSILRKMMHVLIDINHSSTLRADVAPILAR